MTSAGGLGREGDISEFGVSDDRVSLERGGLYDLRQAGPLHPDRPRALAEVGAPVGAAERVAETVGVGAAETPAVGHPARALPRGALRHGRTSGGGGGGGGGLHTAYTALVWARTGAAKLLEVGGAGSEHLTAEAGGEAGQAGQADHLSSVRGAGGQAGVGRGALLGRTLGRRQAAEGVAGPPRPEEEQQQQQLLHFTHPALQ